MNILLKKTLPFLITNIIIGLVLVIIVASKKTDDSVGSIKRDESQEFVLTNPILDYENINQGGSSALSYKEVEDFVESLSRKYEVSQYSIYFRDLNNGMWLGINEKEFFSPASLMKTPVLISFLKKVEQNPELINKEVVATDKYFNNFVNQNFDLKTKIIKGEKYSLEEVAGIMIADSDNVAALMLSEYIDQNDLEALFKMIGISVEEEDFDVDVRVKDFAGFFRILYNSSYLNRTSSEAALNLLSQSTFVSGIVAGVPKGVVVAHKYGERSIEQKQGGVSFVQERQLHDCGIVYAEDSPYILCIMTRGKDFSKQTEFIADISNYVYESAIE